MAFLTHRCFLSGHFHFARYIDSLLQSRILALQRRESAQFLGTDDELQRSHTIARDKTSMMFIGLSVKHYAESVILDVKRVYQALPRLLSLWFEFTAVQCDAPSSKSENSSLRCKCHVASF
jgi:hypothetical protein